MTERPPISVIRWFPVSNGSGEEIPAHGLMRPTSADSDGVITVGKPNSDSDRFIYVNGPSPIPIGGNGVGTKDTPIHVLYDTADGTPANAEEWGAANASWKLRSGKKGWRIIGGVTSGRVMAMQCLCEEEEFHNCDLCVDLLPYRQRVNLPSAPTSASCASAVLCPDAWAAGDHDLISDLPQVCLWYENDTVAPCGAPLVTAIAMSNASVGATDGKMRVGFGTDPGFELDGYATYVQRDATWNCCGSANVLELESNTADCNWPATITVTGLDDNERQTLTWVGTPTSGTFTLTFDGQTTAPIIFNASAAVVQAALELLSTIGIGNVSCSGGPLGTAIIAIVFIGSLASKNVPQLTGSASFDCSPTCGIVIQTTRDGSCGTYP